MRWLAWWLMLAVVLVPTLSQMHAVVHPPAYIFSLANSIVTPTEQAEHADVHPHEPAHERAGVASLFVHHTSLDCVSLDQLAHGHDLPAIGQVLASTISLYLPLWIPKPAVSVPLPRLFEARAPPSRFMAS